jgi:hypothetical protein
VEAFYGGDHGFVAGAKVCRDGVEFVAAVGGVLFEHAFEFSNFGCGELFGHGLFLKEVIRNGVDGLAGFEGSPALFAEDTALLLVVMVHDEVGDFSVFAFDDDADH